MNKELEKDFMNDIMGDTELTVEPTDIAKLLYDIYDVPSGICEQIKNMVQRLEAIDNANPSEAMNCVERLNQTIAMAENFYDSPYEDKDMFAAVKKDVNIIKSTLEQAEQYKAHEKEFDEWKLIQRALKDGFIFKTKIRFKDYELNSNDYIVSLAFSENYNCWEFIVISANTNVLIKSLLIKDYKKTWWLKDDNIKLD